VSAQRKYNNKQSSQKATSVDISQSQTHIRASGLEMLQTVASQSAGETVLYQVVHALYWW